MMTTPILPIPQGNPLATSDGVTTVDETTSITFNGFLFDHVGDGVVNLTADTPPPFDLNVVGTSGNASNVNTIIFTNATVDDTGGTVEVTVTIPPVPPAGGTPGGSNRQLQFNDDGDFGGASGLTTDDGNNLLSTGYLRSRNSYLTPVASGLNYVHETRWPSGMQAYRVVMDDFGTGYLALIGYTPAGEQFFRVGGGPQDNPLSVSLIWNGNPSIYYSFGVSGDGNSRMQMSHGLSIEPYGVLNYVKAGAAGGGWTSTYSGRTDVTSRQMFDMVATWTNFTDGSQKAKLVESVFDTVARPCITREATGTGATMILHVQTTLEAGLIPATMTDAAAPNGSIYNSSDGDCLTHKTASGEIRYLSYTNP
jgi:hypothetical protein